MDNNSLAHTRGLTMRTILVMLVVVSVLFMSACNISSDDYYPNASATYVYCTFEEALSEFATDVVIAQYVGSKPFGKNAIEFEFIVIERVVGNAADRIFVYAEYYLDASVVGYDRHVYFGPDVLTFNPETDYLLPLSNSYSPYAKTHDDGFSFILNIVIDLNDPYSSTMYSELLSDHSTGLDFTRRDISRHEIISYVSESIKYNAPSRDFIRSEVIEDIIAESPCIIVVEINEPRRLVDDQMTTDWNSTDLYYITVTQVLKGDFKIMNEYIIVSMAGTVLSGERYIVATQPIEDGSNWYRFTSKNSLFQMDQLDEIMKIIEKGNDGIIKDDTTTE